MPFFSARVARASERWWQWTEGLKVVERGMREPIPSTYPPKMDMQKRGHGSSSGTTYNCEHEVFLKRGQSGRCDASSLIQVANPLGPCLTVGFMSCEGDQHVTLKIDLLLLCSGAGKQHGS